MSQTSPHQAQPPRVQVDDKGDAPAIIRRWLSGQTIGLLLFCILWDGILVIWYIFAVGGPNATWVMVFFPIVQVVLGVVLTYVAVTGLFNRTVVRVDPENLTVRHGPLPWAGSRSLSRSDICQLYCTPAFVRRDQATGKSTYNVNALLNDGRQIKLLGGLHLSEALYFKQQLEAWLGIEPQHVP
jgi:hypothetical protein